MSQSQASAVFILSGLAGAVLGSLAATRTVLLSAAQYLAGLVSYPPDNPLAISFQKTSNIVIDLAALLLRAGMDDMTLATVVSCLVGVLYTQAFAMVAYAISGRAIPAVATAVLGVATAAYLGGADYPITIFGFQTHGSIGLGLVLYVAGLIGVGWWRAAALLLGLAPAVHPVMGTWLLGTAAVCWLILAASKKAPMVFPPAIRGWFVTGVGLTALGLGGNAVLGTTAQVPEADPVYLKAFLEMWDYHRNIAIDTRILLILAQVALVLSALFAWLWAGRSEGLTPRRTMGWLLAVGGVMALVVYLAYHGNRDAFPLLAVRAIPTRVLNLPESLTLPLLAGILLARRDLLSLTGAAVLLVTPVLVFQQIIPAGSVAWVKTLATAFAAGCAIAITLRPALAAPIRVPAPLGALGRRIADSVAVVPPVVLHGVLTSAVVAGLLIKGPLSFSGGAATMFRTIEDIDGLLLVCDGVDASQLSLRKGFVIDPLNLDFIPYVPAAAPAAARILAEVYGVNYFDPPLPVRGQAGLVRGVSRQAWEARSQEEWQRLGAKYGFGSVIAENSWTIKLPKIMVFRSSSEFAIYRLGSTERR
ncbi:MAG: hypothetical protein H7840_03155 [Alphaproteobacteria bacterium]